MEFVTKYITPAIKLAQYDGKVFKTEVLFEDHMLVWFISGETKIIQSDSTSFFGAGDTFLIPRNELATVINYPIDGKPHKTVAMHITQERLKDYYHRHPTQASNPLSLKKIRRFDTHPLLESCLASLIPYFHLTNDLPEVIAGIKIEEAISILRTLDPAMDDLLADFGEPGKINLTDFMQRHYMFNMPLEKFGYLTGRSLATFRRDFQRAFQTTPQRWLTRKRLELAHHMLVEKQYKPIDVFLEAGFENLSHFSYAFKKEFGYAPTVVNNAVE